MGSDTEGRWYGPPCTGLAAPGPVKLDGLLSTLASRVCCSMTTACGRAREKEVGTPFRSSPRWREEVHLFPSAGGLESPFSPREEGKGGVSGS